MVILVCIYFVYLYLDYYIRRYRKYSCIFNLGWFFGYFRRKEDSSFRNS